MTPKEKIDLVLSGDFSEGSIAIDYDELDSVDFNKVSISEWVEQMRIKGAFVQSAICDKDSK